MAAVRFLCILLGALALCACGKSASPAPVVLAAASLQGALDDAADAWAAQGHPRPVLSYAGTPALARQIEGGAPADIAIFADREWMEHLEQRKLIRASTRRDVIGNRLVVIRPAENAPRDDASLAQVLGTGRIALADPETVPAGRYAKAALVTLGLWDGARARVVPTENVRSALALVEQGEVAAATVYASDAAASDRVRIVSSIPPAAHPPIRYPAALLGRAGNADAAAFLDFLGSAKVRAIFLAHGFSPLPAASGR